MTNDDSGRQKSAVSSLRFGKKTAKRVAWEAWEFTVVAPGRVRVTNASYGVEKEQHSYVVIIEERDGRPLPTECECPADEWNEDYDCKHKVALAAVGGPVVMEAAQAFRHQPREATASPEDHPGSKRVRTDGGTEECECAAWSILCWDCYQHGTRAVRD
jgi:hypothetical protein